MSARYYYDRSRSRSNLYVNIIGACVGEETSVTAVSTTFYGFQASNPLSVRLGSDFDHFLMPISEIRK